MSSIRLSPRRELFLPPPAESNGMSAPWIYIMASICRICIMNGCLQNGAGWGIETCQRSVGNPLAKTPRSSRDFSFCFCRAFSFEGLPAAFFFRRPRMPCASIVFAQLLTVARLTPKCRAISAWLSLPDFKRRPPSSRLSSICSRVKYDGFHVIPTIVNQSPLT